MTGNVTSISAVIQVAQLAKVIRGMTPEQLLQYEAQGEIDLPPHHFNAGEIKVCSSHWLYRSMLAKLTTVKRQYSLSQQATSRLHLNTEQ